MVRMRSGMKMGGASTSTPASSSCRRLGQGQQQQQQCSKGVRLGRSWSSLQTLRILSEQNQSQQRCCSSSSSLHHYDSRALHNKCYRHGHSHSRSRKQQLKLRAQHFGYDVVDVNRLSLGIKADGWLYSNNNNNTSTTTTTNINGAANYTNNMVNDSHKLNSSNKRNNNNRKASMYRSDRFRHRSNSSSGGSMVMDNSDDNSSSSNVHDTKGIGMGIGSGIVGGRIMKIVATIRAILFYAVSLIIACPIFIFMIVIFPLVYAFDRERRTVYGKLNTFWAIMSTVLFFRVKVEGKENLPDEKEAVVYVANHASYLDIYSMYHLRRSLKYISKLSNFLIPVVGWSMWLTGHVPLQRMDQRSQLNCLKQCGELLSNGSSLIFFPEGTRSADGTMASFKKGAFSIASKKKKRVVPVTLIGTNTLMANGKEGQLYPGEIRVIVHEPMDCEDANQTMKDAEEIIGADCLRYQVIE